MSLTNGMMKKKRGMTILLSHSMILQVSGAIHLLYTIPREEHAEGAFCSVVRFMYYEIRIALAIQWGSSNLVFIAF